MGRPLFVHIACLTFVTANCCLVGQSLFVRNFEICDCVLMTGIESCWKFHFESLLRLVFIAG